MHLRLLPFFALLAVTANCKQRSEPPAASAKEVASDIGRGDDPGVYRYYKEGSNYVSAKCDDGKPVSADFCQTDIIKVPAATVEAEFQSTKDNMARRLKEADEIISVLNTQLGAIDAALAEKPDPDLSTERAGLVDKLGEANSNRATLVAQEKAFEDGLDDTFKKLNRSPLVYSIMNDTDTFKDNRPFLARIISVFVRVKEDAAANAAVEASRVRCLQTCAAERDTCLAIAKSLRNDRSGGFGSGVDISGTCIRGFNDCQADCAQAAARARN